jgi:hypothetical protein
MALRRFSVPTVGRGKAAAAGEFSEPEVIVAPEAVVAARPSEVDGGYQVRAAQRRARADVSWPSFLKPVPAERIAEARAWLTERGLTW